MTVATSQSSAESSLRPEIRRILASGRVELSPGTGSIRSVFLVALASSILLWLAFTPI